MAVISSPFLSLLCIHLFLGSLVFTGIKALETNPETQESDRVVDLPGQPSNPSISQFSGYVTVNKEHGRALFYWFFEAHSETSKKPLLLWLNGGPGCSSIGYGAASELGPLRVSKDGAGVYFNEYAWSKEANLLFLESPVGVGFSYTNTSSDLTILDDNFVAEDAYTFLVKWLQRFPQYKSHDFFISGESYAGHYVPQLAELVYDRNKDTTKYPLINLKGFIVGNPETNDYYDYKGLLEYAWSHAVISDQLYDKAKQVCDFRVPNWSNDCNDAMNFVFEKYSEIDIYNIYAPTCLINTTSSSAGSSDSSTKANNYMTRRLRIPGVGNSRGKWRVCNDLILNRYNFTVFSVLPIYTKLIKGGLKIWIYRDH
ncbi:hypothetical protein OIU84_019382 [Salix udensis]|uniref:Carboxypeptidase n=1 Tax=Salix udensis TaxID=889485 RepID=A0AAD6KYR2_9ROSI|nr:hypothetical protein OIU84_019382 [Salix udensis]